MPFAVDDAAIAAIASTVLSQGINAGVQGKMNRKSRLFSEKMAQVQYDRSLASWNMQNAYNHPSEQMKRFKEAGLNPHLAYGQGALAMSGKAGDISPSQSPDWNPRAPQVDLTPGVMGFVDARLKAAQIDLVREQQKVAFQESLYKESQTAQTIASTDTTRFDLEQKMRLKDISASAAQANLAKTLADTKFTLDQNERAAIAQTQSLAESVQRIANMRLEGLKTQEQTTEVKAQVREIEARIKNIKADTGIKNEDLKLKKKGIQPHDQLWQRRVAEEVDNIMQPKTKPPGFTTPGAKRDSKGKLQYQATDSN